MTPHDEIRANRAVPMLRIACAAFVAWAFLSTMPGELKAGIILECDASMGAEACSSVSPLLPTPAFPLVRHGLHESPLFGAMNETGGAGSQTTTSGASHGLAVLDRDRPVPGPASIASRLYAIGCLWLPSPLEDRFFRPPRV